MQRTPSSENLMRARSPAARPAISPRPSYSTQPRIDLARRTSANEPHFADQFSRFTPLQRSLAKLLIGAFAILVIKALVWDTKPPTPPGEIAHPALLERITLGSPLSGQALDARKHSFLQSRIGRDERPDLFSVDIKKGLQDFWERFQVPFSTAPETVHLDEQVIKSVIDELMSFNGWAAAACSSLTRPFGAHRSDDAYTDLTRAGELYYFALVVHSADHFLLDQLAVVVQLGRRLGTDHIFVSIVDYGSTDKTPFLCDMIDMVLTLLGVSFRIRRVDSMTSDPQAAYYPLEEAYTRNLALEPLWELWERRRVRFSKVIWLKGFACPTDILETLRVATVNDAAMTCSMDWKEHNGFFIYNDRWRTRDLDGNLFRGSKSTSPLDEAPPRDPIAIERYAAHLPFQVFCCESGVHIVNPAKSYYAGISYRSSAEHGVFNITAAGDGKAPKWSEGPCMDSAQMHFCRDMWLVAAQEGIKQEAKRAKARERKGQARELSDQYEDLVGVVVPQYAKPGKAQLAAIKGGRKGLLSNEEMFDEDDEEEDEEGAPAVPEGAKGEVDGAPPEAVKEMPAVDKGVIAAADAAAAVLPADEQHVADEDEEDTQPVDEAANAKGPVAQVQVDEKAAAKEKADAQKDHAKAVKVPAKPVPAKAAEQPVNEKAPAKAPEVQPKQAADQKKPPKQKRQESERPVRRKPLPNSAFAAARIIVNPRCVTTYAGVSHTQLAMDLFGNGEDEEPAQHEGGKYALDEWRTAPETFEMRSSGGRTAAKQQRRTGFVVARAMAEGWRPQR